MDIEVTALVVRLNGGITQIQQIRDEEADVQVIYPWQGFSLGELTEALLRRGFSSAQIGGAIRAYSNGQDVALDGYAANMPDIGAVSVSVETKNLIWPET